MEHRQSILLFSRGDSKFVTYRKGTNWGSPYFMEKESPCLRMLLYSDLMHILNKKSQDTLFFYVV